MENIDNWVKIYSDETILLSIGKLKKQMKKNINYTNNSNSFDMVRNLNKSTYSNFIVIIIILSVILIIEENNKRRIEKRRKK